jgi:quinol monooxygenase YgiN
MLDLHEEAVQSGQLRGYDAGGERECMGRIVIACYRPKPGQQDALRALLQKHVATLRSLGLVTNRAPIAMQSSDGTFVEVFEWGSAEAIQAAHAHPVVQKMWEEYGKVCDYVPLARIPEASQMFSELTPVHVDE